MVWLAHSLQQSDLLRGLGTYLGSKVPSAAGWLPLRPLTATQHPNVLPLPTCLNNLPITVHCTLHCAKHFSRYRCLRPCPHRDCGSQEQARIVLLQTRLNLETTLAFSTTPALFHLSLFPILVISPTDTRLAAYPASTGILNPV